MPACGGAIRRRHDDRDGGVARLHDGERMACSTSRRPGHLDRRRPDACEPIFWTRAWRRSATGMTASTTDRQRPAGRSGRNSRGARVPLRARAPVHRGERAFAMALADHCAHASACSLRRRAPLAEALAVFASIGEHLALARPGRGASHAGRARCPAVADQCVVDLVHGSGSSVARSSTPIPRTPRALSASHPDRQRHAGRGRDPRRPDAARAGDAGAARQRTTPSTVRRKGDELRSMLTAPLVFADARRVDVRLEARARSTTRTSSLRRALATRRSRSQRAYQETHGERERLSALVRQLPLS
jgi:hypothetical protein